MGIRPPQPAGTFFLIVLASSPVPVPGVHFPAQAARPLVVLALTLAFVTVRSLVANYWWVLQEWTPTVAQTIKNNAATKHHDAAACPPALARESITGSSTNGTTPSKSRAGVCGCGALCGPAGLSSSRWMVAEPMVVSDQRLKGNTS